MSPIMEMNKFIRQLNVGADSSALGAISGIQIILLNRMIAPAWVGQYVHRGPIYPAPVNSLSHRLTSIERFVALI
jgi:hypothetical protein